MATRLSRRKIATHVADCLLAGESAVIDSLAALIVSDGRQREAELIVRDIEAELAVRGELVVTVEAARPIDSATRAQIEQMFKGKKVHIREEIKPELIGGVRITTPTERLDATLAKKIADLRSKKTGESE